MGDKPLDPFIYTMNSIRDKFDENYISLTDAVIDSSVLTAREILSKKHISMHDEKELCDCWWFWHSKRFEMFTLYCDMDAESFMNLMFTKEQVKMIKEIIGKYELKVCNIKEGYTFKMKGTNLIYARIKMYGCLLSKDTNYNLKQLVKEHPVVAVYNRKGDLCITLDKEIADRYKDVKHSWFIDSSDIKNGYVIATKYATEDKPVLFYKYGCYARMLYMGVTNILLSNLQDSDIEVIWDTKGNVYAGEMYGED